MRRRIKILTLLILTTLGFILAFPFLEKGFAKTQVVTDLLERKVNIPEKVEKIVAIGPGCLRLVVYLQASNKVVGVEHGEKFWPIYYRPYRIAHPEFGKLPIIGQSGPNPKPNPEAILKLKPDLIFACYITREQAEHLQIQTGIPVVVLSYGKLATFATKELITSLKLMGKILHKEKRAEKVIHFIKSSLKELNERTKDIPENQKPRVYVGAIGYKGIRGIESTFCNYPPFVAVNARNVVDSLHKKDHVFVSKEMILRWNPDIIFIDRGGLKLVLEDIKRNSWFYKSLKAFRTGQVYTLLPYNFYTTNIGTALADAYYIGKVLYPQKFKDINPEKKADEIYTFLVGKPVYKEMKKHIGGFGRLSFKLNSLN